MTENWSTEITAPSEYSDSQNESMLWLKSLKPRKGYKGQCREANYFTKENPGCFNSYFIHTPTITWLSVAAALVTDPRALNILCWFSLPKQTSWLQGPVYSPMIASNYCTQCWEGSMLKKKQHIDIITNSAISLRYRPLKLKTGTQIHVYEYSQQHYSQ